MAILGVGATCNEKAVVSLADLGQKRFETDREGTLYNLADLDVAGRNLKGAVLEACSPVRADITFKKHRAGGGGIHPEETKR